MSRRWGCSKTGNSRPCTVVRRPPLTRPRSRGLARQGSPGQRVVIRFVGQERSAVRLRDLAAVAEPIAVLFRWIPVQILVAVVLTAALNVLFHRSRLNGG